MTNIKHKEEILEVKVNHREAIEEATRKLELERKKLELRNKRLEENNVKL